MTTGANSYGSAAKVAALTRRYTDSGAYSMSTNPTQAAVEGWIDDVSAMLNTCLAQSGFTIPVTQADTKMAVAAFVDEVVADLCHAANNTGRFFTERALAAGVSPMRAIRKEAAVWVEEMAAGFAALGAARGTPDAGQVAFRDVDESGNSINPIFQRSGFGNSFQNWDGR